MLINDIFNLLTCSALEVVWIGVPEGPLYATWNCAAFKFFRAEPFQCADNVWGQAGGDKGEDFLHCGPLTLEVPPDTGSFCSLLISIPQVLQELIQEGIQCYLTVIQTDWLLALCFSTILFYQRLWWKCRQLKWSLTCPHDGSTITFGPVTWDLRSRTEGNVLRGGINVLRSRPHNKGVGTRDTMFIQDSIAEIPLLFKNFCCLFFSHTVATVTDASEVQSHLDWNKTRGQQ